MENMKTFTKGYHFYIVVVDAYGKVVHIEPTTSRKAARHMLRGLRKLGAMFGRRIFITEEVL